MNPVYDFRGQVALVTGASSGIGLATAKAFSEAGAAVVLVDINENALRVATGELTSAGHRAIGVTCNVADEAQVAAIVKRTVATFSKLEMAFNNAGILGPVGDMTDETSEAFDDVTAVNLRGVWTCMKHELLRCVPKAAARHRQLFLAWRPRGPGGPDCLLRDQPWLDRVDKERRDGLCAAWHSHQCRVPWRDRYTHGRGNGA
jgi:NAD(P)-dependent dehydrogenase (short-subunit alcohol dehydrogenase family)